MIYIVSALQSEAMPLVTHFGLKFCSHGSPFKIYRNNGMALIVSGVGKIRSASAVSYLGKYFEEENSSIWLNIGIGGMATVERGVSFLAHKITDRATEKSSYPSIVFDVPCQTAEVVTVDRPATDHQKGIVFDMEASGFFHTAMLFSNAELIHSYKVISDFDESSMKQVTRDYCKKLIEDKIPEVELIIERLASLITEENSIGDVYEKLVKKWHFSQTEQVQLRRNLERWEACRGERTLDFKELLSLKDSREVIKKLDEFIQSTPLTYS